MNYNCIRELLVKCLFFCYDNFVLKGVEVMTLFEEVYYQLGDFPKFYRYEGVKTYKNYDFKNEEHYLESTDSYIYFSKSRKHHEYYIQKKLKQLIEREILYQTKYSLQKNCVINNEKFQEVITKIENYPVEFQQNSIEFTTSPTVNRLFYKNAILNLNKKSSIPYIERVDKSKVGGGYGLCKDWLEVFNILTFIFVIQKITKADVLDYVYSLRRSVAVPNFKVNVTGFLMDPKRKNIKINERIYNDFTKYDLMNALQNIVENEWYFKDSYMAKNPDEFIKKIIQDYTLERENILELIDSSYKRNLVKNHNLKSS